MRAAALVALVFAAACGHYGSPERASEQRRPAPAATPASAPAEPPTNDEQCEEPAP